MTGTAIMHLLAEGVDSGIASSLAFGLCGGSFLLSWFLFGLFLPKLAEARSSSQHANDLLASSTDTEVSVDKETPATPISGEAPGSSRRLDAHAHHHLVPEILSLIFVFALAFHSFFAGLVLGLQRCAPCVFFLVASCLLFIRRRQFFCGHSDHLCVAAGAQVERGLCHGLGHCAR